MAKNGTGDKASPHVEVEDLVAQTDTGARQPVGFPRKILFYVPLFWALFQVYIASKIPFILTRWTGINLTFNSDEARAVHLAFAIFLAAMAFPLFKSSPRDRIPWYDWVLGFVGVAAALYLPVFKDAIADRPGLWTTTDLVVSAFGLVVLLIATYRALGLPLVVVASVFMLYVFFGDRPFLPDAIQWKGASMSKALGHFWMQTEGVFGVALGVSTSMVFLFVLFGSLLEKAGAGGYFIKTAFAMLGRFRGGPAKAAVLSSAMTGMISGSSIANTVTTGTFTIPLMKRVGFSAEKAGAIEVASSTNGQLTPPVMGAAAFLMVEYVGISYMDVVRNALLPALISYIALLYIVHLEALKMGLEGLPPSGPRRTILQRLAGTLLGFLVVAGLSGILYYGLGWMKDVAGDATVYVAMVLFLVGYLALAYWAAQSPDLEVDDPSAPMDTVPELGKTVRTGLYYLLPIVVLVWCLMIERFSPGLSAFWATMGMLFITVTQHAVKSFFRGQGIPSEAFAKGWNQLIDGLIAGSRNMIGIAVATGAAGIIVGTISLTGAHQVMGEFVEFLSGGNLMLMLIFVAILSLILGMGLPTTANYIVVSSLMAPVIVALGAKTGLIVPLIAVHMFVFYFGILADDTPPVGLAAFAASAISGGDPIKTGIQGFAYDIRTAILPFLFIFNNQLLLIGIDHWYELVFTIVGAVAAMLIFAAATQGYFLVRSRLWESALLLLVTFTLFRPGFWMDMIYPPFEIADARQIVEFAGGRPADYQLRLLVEGESMDGKFVSKTVLLPLGTKGNGAQRLAQAGIEVRTEGDKVFVDNVVFGSAAEKAGIDFDWRIRGIEVKVSQPVKYWFYIPALAIFGIVVLSQLRRRPRRVAEALA